MKIYLAPMEGVVDPVIRDLFSHIGGYDYMCTEFIRVTDKLNPAKLFHRYAPELKNNGKTSSGTPVFVQLLGGQAQPMAENAALACELGAPGIDINFGCPAKTVNRHDGGAALLQNPHRLYDIITAIKKAVPQGTPVSAKVRLGFEDKSLCQEIAKAVDEARAHHLIIHARTKKEAYRPPAHWEYIAQMKEQATNTPIIANGDIWSIEDYHRCVEISGCSDVALGRGAYAKPSLAVEIKNQQKSITWFDMQKRWLPEFIRKSEAFKSDNYALTRTKQWVKHLARNYPEATDAFNNIKTKTCLSEVNSIYS